MPNNSRVKNPDYSDETYVGTIAGMPCHICKLRGESLTDKDANWKLWMADKQVYRDGAAASGNRSSDDDDDEEEVFASLDEEILANLERTRKAILWFSVSEKLREEYLVDLGGRDKTSDDCLKRLHDNLAPPGMPYTTPEPLEVTEQMREGMRKAKARKSARKNLKK